MSLLKNKIAIIGVGNVGSVLASEFSKKYEVIAFDTDVEKIKAFINNKAFKRNQNLKFTAEKDDLLPCSVYIIAVSTGIKNDNTPDITALSLATSTVATLLKLNDTVIFESTVYPGCTEEHCIPLLENISGLKLNIDFGVGFSPERLNTGDKKNTISNTTKITSGSNPNVALFVKNLYQSILKSKVHLVSSIKIAEATKIIENAQRDLNIAFMNQVAVTLSKLDIPFNEVFEACRTKWNFLNFRPGLVGGECLSLASTYLEHISSNDISLSKTARKINDLFPQKIVEIITAKLNTLYDNHNVVNALILGVTYKANHHDTKGSLIPHLAEALTNHSINVKIYDPIASSKSIKYMTDNPNTKKYQLVIKAVNHKIFDYFDIKEIAAEKFIFLDVNDFKLKVEN